MMLVDDKTITHKGFRRWSLIKCMTWNWHLWAEKWNCHRLMTRRKILVVENFSASPALIYRYRFALQLISITQFIPSCCPPTHFSLVFICISGSLCILLKCVLRKYHVLMCTQLIFFRLAPSTTHERIEKEKGRRDFGVENFTRTV